MNTPKWFQNVITFYGDGFKNMTIGRTLWALVIIKLFIMFAILKVFFFPNFLKTNFNTDKERSSYVRDELINKSTTERKKSKTNIKLNTEEVNHNK